MYAKALKSLGSQKAVALWANKSEAYVSTFIKLTEAPEEVQELSETVTDATALQLVSRLLTEAPAEGQALLEQIRTGKVEGGALRTVARGKLADTKGKIKAPTKPGKSKPKDAGNSGASQPLQILQATAATWQHDGDLLILRIETESGPFAIELPAGFSMEVK